MVQKLNAMFDGSQFFPYGPVDVEAGTDVELTVTPIRHVVPVPYKRPLTEAEERAWAEMTERCRIEPPVPPTLEEAMRQLRGRP